MQSGKIKRWNQDKGYGFIDVDNQSEDVFFHVSKVRLSQPISVGQKVYFNSERNDKNQLRATEVTSNTLSILDTSVSDLTPHDSNTNRQNHANNRADQSRRNQNHQRGSHYKRSALSTLFSLIALIAVAVYFFGDINSAFFAEDNAQTSLTQSASENSNQAATAGITGDAQIDHTIALIQQGGPFPYPQKDGTTFYNREGRLPAQSQGYYREYTVPTVGVSHRGGRRIVTGGHPPTVYYLTVDHYDSFSRLQVK